MLSTDSESEAVLGSAVGDCGPVAFLIFSEGGISGTVGINILADAQSFLV